MPGDDHGTASEIAQRGCHPLRVLPGGPRLRRFGRDAMAGQVQSDGVKAIEHLIPVVMVPAPAVQGQHPGRGRPVTCAPEAPTGESAERHRSRPKDYSPVWCAVRDALHDGRAASRRLVCARRQAATILPLPACPSRRTSYGRTRRAGTHARSRYGAPLARTAAPGPLDPTAAGPTRWPDPPCRFPMPVTPR